MYARRRDDDAYPEGKKNALQTRLGHGHERARSQGGQEGKQAWSPSTARGECKCEAERQEKQGGRYDTSSHVPIARYRNQTPMTAIIPPMLRVATMPRGSSLRRPRQIPATCSKPVARTKPAL